MLGDREVFVLMRCKACNGGYVIPMTGWGRKAWYKGRQYPVPDDLAIPTCDNCRAEWLNKATTIALDAAMLKARIEVQTNEFGAKLGTEQPIPPLERPHLCCGCGEDWAEGDDTLFCSACALKGRSA